MTHSLDKLHRQGLVATLACLALITGGGGLLLADVAGDTLPLTATRVGYLAAIALGVPLLVGFLVRQQARIRALMREDLYSLRRIARDVRDGTVRVDYPLALAEFGDAFRALRDSGRRLVEEKERLRDMGLIDPLSQLGNRRHLDERLQELHETVPTHGPSALLLIDVDKFKQVNDRHGHDCGDALITGFAQALRERVRHTDIVVRLGGDEFCVIYPYTPLDTARLLVERLRKQMPRELTLLRGVRHSLRWSGGVSSMHDGDSAPDEVLWRADQALLRAKQAGRNLTLGFDPVHGPEEIRHVMPS